LAVILVEESIHSWLSSLSKNRFTLGCHPE
jgi:hypothetical protein